MGRFLISRVLQGVVVLWVVATLTFLLMHLVPGGPFDRERHLPPEILANIAAKYRLDDPLPVQYLRYLKDLLGGNLGLSYKYVDRTVNAIVADTLPVSATLGLYALLFALLFSFPVSLVAASRPNTLSDRLALFLATLGVSLPSFVLGAFLMWFFSLKLGWVDSGGWGQGSSMILPVVTLGAAPAAYLSYLLRTTLIESLGEDFIRTARAKGLGEPAVLVKHALRNSLIPVLTVLGPLGAALVTGSFVVEYVFAVPGMGRFFITAVTDRDYPMIMGVTMMYTALLVGGNLLVDLCYTLVDPRIKIQDE
jgi:oligopeptide transport system permease protein